MRGPGCCGTEAAGILHQPPIIPRRSKVFAAMRLWRCWWFLWHGALRHGPALRRGSCACMAAGKHRAMPASPALPPPPHARADGKRPVCARSARPHVACLCPWLTLLRLSLVRCQVHVGELFEPVELALGPLADWVLLYPGDSGAPGPAAGPAAAPDVDPGGHLPGLGT